MLEGAQLERSPGAAAHLDPSPPEGGEGYSVGSIWRTMTAVFLENRMAIVGLGMIAFVVLFSFVGPLIYRTQQFYNNPVIANHAPTLAHPLGTDQVGYDVVGRLMLGGQKLARNWIQRCVHRGAGRRSMGRCSGTCRRRSGLAHDAIG